MDEIESRVRRIFSALGETLVVNFAEYRPELAAGEKFIFLLQEIRGRPTQEQLHNAVFSAIANVANLKDNLKKWANRLLKKGTGSRRCSKMACKSRTAAGACTLFQRPAKRNGKDESVVEPHIKSSFHLQVVLDLWNGDKHGYPLTFSHSGREPRRVPLACQCFLSGSLLFPFRNPLDDALGSGMMDGWSRPRAVVRSHARKLSIAGETGSAGRLVAEMAHDRECKVPRSPNPDRNRALDPNALASQWHPAKLSAAVAGHGPRLPGIGKERRLLCSLSPAELPMFQWVRRRLVSTTAPGSLCAPLFKIRWTVKRAPDESSAFLGQHPDGDKHR
ncbi:MAG: hypothetical protein WD069_04955 [Planctomycetales bacterium]